MHANTKVPVHDVNFRITVDGRDRVAPAEMVSTSDPHDAYATLCTLLGYCTAQLNSGNGVEYRVEIRLEELSSAQIARLYGLMPHTAHVLRADLSEHRVKAAVSDYSITFNRIRSKGDEQKT